MTANPPLRQQPPLRAKRLETIKELLLDQQPGERASFSHISWQEYDQLCQFRDQERKGVRLTYDSGDLEAMTITFQHENYKGILAVLIDIACLVKRLPRKSAGSLTIRREDLEKGFEPDSSYYIQNVQRVIPVRELDFSVDPPPDLAIEVELSNSITSKLHLYADMGIPEVWRTDGERVTILRLQENDSYQQSNISLALIDITADELNRFFLRGIHTDETTLSLEWQDYLLTKPS
jgi:Uma2 family endonuclease